tara:strand:- start:1103 stop:4054 length:2952 start_codon:yes stop_codon:yes gene_type:complete
MTNFTDTFGQTDDRLYYSSSAWQSGADNPPAGKAVYQTISTGSASATVTSNAISIGRVTSDFTRTLVRFSLPEKPYNDNLEILDVRIMLRLPTQSSAPTMALYQVASNLNLTDVSWWYVSDAGNTYWSPSRSGTHSGGTSTQLQDSSGNFKDANLTGIGSTHGSKVLNTTDGCSGTIPGLASNTVTDAISLSGGSGNNFDNGDEYIIIGGGNPIINTDYGYGSNGIIDVVAPAGTGDFTSFSLKNFFVNNKPEWGKSYGFMIKAYDEGSLGTNEYALNATSGGSISNAKIEIEYDNPKPNRPLIQVTPKSDGINTDISFTEEYSGADSDLQNYIAVFKQAADPAYHASGVSSGTYGATLTDVGKNVFTTSDLTSDGSDSFLKTDNTEYRIQFYAQDNQNTGSATLAQPGNIVSITRPGVNASSAVDDTSPTVGQQITLTINATGGMFSGNVKRFAVNWDSGASDTDKDYSFVELDEVASSTTITHRYHSSGAKAIKVQVEDELGFRSSRVALSSQPTVTSPTPIAEPKISRAEVLNTDYNDSASAFYITGQNSFAIGSDRTLSEYKYKTTDGSQYMTSFALNNDNTVFEDGSKKLKLKCSLPDCGSTRITVYGLVSLSFNSADNTTGNIVDTDSTFSHYQWQSVGITSPDNITDFSASSDEFFKRVDMVVVDTLDAQDTGARYMLLTDDNQLVNTQIRAVKQDYRWGGSAVANPSNAQTSTSDVAPQNITVNVNSGFVITDIGGGTADFLTQGFAPGDNITISGHDQAANNGTFAIDTNHDSVTETVIRLAGTPLTDDASSTCKIIKDTSFLTSISCAADDAQTNAVKHRVKDSAGSLSTEVQTDNIVVLSNTNRFLDLLTEINNKSIAILSTSFSRSGGVGSNMALGDKRYPVGVIQTKLGLPTFSANIRILKHSGYVKLWALLEGGRYNWAVVDTDIVDSPYTTFKRLRVKCTGGTITQDPSNAGQYLSTLNFVVIGEHLE